MLAETGEYSHQACTQKCVYLDGAMPHYTPAFITTFEHIAERKVTIHTAVPCSDEAEKTTPPSSHPTSDSLPPIGSFRSKAIMDEAFKHATGIARAPVFTAPKSNGDNKTLVGHLVGAQALMQIKGQDQSSQKDNVSPTASKTTSPLYRSGAPSAATPKNNVATLTRTRTSGHAIYFPATPTNFQAPTALPLQIPANPPSLMHGIVRKPWEVPTQKKKTTQKSRSGQPSLLQMFGSAAIVPPGPKVVLKRKEFTHYYVNVFNTGNYDYFLDDSAARKQFDEHKAHIKDSIVMFYPPRDKRTGKVQILTPDTLPPSFVSANTLLQFGTCSHKVRNPLLYKRCNFIVIGGRDFNANDHCHSAGELIQGCSKLKSLLPSKSAVTLALPSTAESSTPLLAASATGPAKRSACSTMSASSKRPKLATSVVMPTTQSSNISGPTPPTINKRKTLLTSPSTTRPPKKLRITLRSARSHATEELSSQASGSAESDSGATQGAAAADTDFSEISSTHSHETSSFICGSSSVTSSAPDNSCNEEASWGTSDEEED